MFKISCKYITPKDELAYWEISAVVEKPDELIEKIKPRLDLEELCNGFDGKKSYFLRVGNVLKIYVPDDLNMMNMIVIGKIRAYIVSNNYLNI